MIFKLSVNGETHEFVDIHQFRQIHQLSDDFGIRLFEQKDYQGLARLDQPGSSTALTELKATVLGAVPAQITYANLMNFLVNLSALFRIKLYEVNDAVGLRPAEVDFAAAGFEDVCQRLGYSWIRAKATHSPLATFEEVYQAWLDDTVRIAHTVYEYQTWTVRIINNAYGRIGLMVSSVNNTDYVRDTSYACPAEGYMMGLLQQVAHSVQQSLG